MSEKTEDQTTDCSKNCEKTAVSQLDQKANEGELWPQFKRHLHEFYRDTTESFFEKFAKEIETLELQPKRKELKKPEGFAQEILSMLADDWLELAKMMVLPGQEEGISPKLCEIILHLMTLLLVQVDGFDDFMEAIDSDDDDTDVDDTDGITKSDTNNDTENDTENGTKMILKKIKKMSMRMKHRPNQTH